MRNIPLIALRRCPGHAEGEEFLATHVEAKALVAIGKAKRADTAPAREYFTRDMSIQPVSKVEKQINASPAAAKLVEEKGVALSEIAGSGKDGRITLKDVENAD